MLNLNLKLMGYSPFKMKYSGKGQGVPALMKALVGNQDRLPEQLKQAIKDAPETSKKDSPVKSYGSKKKSPVMKTETMDYRKGKGRINRKTGKIQETNVSSSAVTGGARLTKKDEKGNRTWVVKEKPAMGKKSLASGVKTTKSKPSAKADLSNLKKKDAKSKSPAMMKGVKGLKNQRGKK